MNSVALRVQRLERRDQVLVLLHLAQVRSQSGLASPRDIAELYLDLALPPPSKPANVLLALAKSGMAVKGPQRGSWRLSPLGRDRLVDLDFEGDLPHLLAEMASTGLTAFGGVEHPVVPPEMAPPEIAHAVRGFLKDHPFETNVFAMTRFPADEPEDPDPVQSALEIARTTMRMHGLELHVASDRAIVDDLWMNVTAHMWASRFGVALFEDRRARGINHNMLIEVGAMLTMGRRCALIKDRSIGSMPTDLVGRIYKSVDLTDDSAVGGALHGWIRDDLGLDRCSACP